VGEDDDEIEVTDDSLLKREMESEDGPSVQLPNVRCLARPLAKDKMATAIDDIFVRYEENVPSSSRGSSPYRAVPSMGAIENCMYLLYVHSRSTYF
jgi:hypothetical protein